MPLSKNATIGLAVAVVIILIIILIIIVAVVSLRAHPLTFMVEHMHGGNRGAGGHFGSYYGGGGHYGRQRRPRRGAPSWWLRHPKWRLRSFPGWGSYPASFWYLNFNGLYNQAALTCPDLANTGQLMSLCDLCRCLCPTGAEGACSMCRSACPSAN